jgi:hypothetical protein
VNEADARGKPGRNAGVEQRADVMGMNNVHRMLAKQANQLADDCRLQAGLLVKKEESILEPGEAGPCLDGLAVVSLEAHD